MRALSDYLVRKAGMTLGLYTARGRLTCCGLAGSLNHEAEDARRFAVDWNASYVKMDSCHGTPNDPKGSPPGTAAIAQYRNFSRGLNATGRHVILDACWDACWPPASCMAAGPPLLIGERASAANSWRIGPDGVSWGRSMLNVELDSNLSSFAGAGHWNNPGLLISSSNDGATPGPKRRISEKQVRTQFSLFAVLASPLIISGSVIFMTPGDVQTYTNREAIAISQDAACHQGTRLVGSSLVNEQGNPIGVANVWGRLLANGGLALLFVNTAGTPKGQAGGANISCDVACFHASGWTAPAAGAVLQVRDVWGASNLTLKVAAGGPSLVATNISTDGCVLLVITPPPAAAATADDADDATADPGSSRIKTDDDNGDHQQHVTAAAAAAELSLWPMPTSTKLLSSTCLSIPSATGFAFKSTCPGLSEGLLYDVYYTTV